MKERPTPYPHLHLNIKEVWEIKSFYEKYGVKWTAKREGLLRQGHRGRLDKPAYKRYCRLLRRIHYEMNCVVTSQPIQIEGSDRLTDTPYNLSFITQSRTKRFICDE